MSKIKTTLILLFALVPGFALADSETPATPPEVATAVVAEKVEEAKEVKLDLTATQPIVLVEPIKLASAPKAQPIKKEEPKAAPPVTHDVQSGDTLSSIADSHQTVWPRIYDANTEIEDPNVIRPGQKLRIPNPDEQITSRTPAAPAAPAAPAPVAVAAAPVTTRVDAAVATPELIGSYGYLVNGPNCVNTAKAHGKNQPNNPSSWVATTQTPYVGAGALFYFNHVAIVAGIHSDGSIEVIHENCPSCPTRYSRGTFRGFF